MYILPSAKDKRLAALRERARTVGLNVKLAHIDQVDPEPHERVSSAGQKKYPQVACTAYQLSHDVAHLQQIDDQVILRLPATATVSVDEVYPGWGGVAGGDLSIFQRDEFFARWLEELPSEVIAVGVGGRFVSCFWRESGTAESGLIEQLYTCLKDYLNHFSS